MRYLLYLLALLWAGPYTLFGLLIGLCGLCTGGGGQRRGHVLEFQGGAVRWFLRHLPVRTPVMAITFGHTVLAQTAAALDLTRDHERVHVRQYERWGLLFGPAYLLASLVLWCRGRDAYGENPFEREAFAASDPRDGPLG